MLLEFKTGRNIKLETPEKKAKIPTLK